MKLLLITIYTFIILISSAKAEECIYTYETTPEESKYTKQFSIKTDREGHAVRIFALENTYKNNKKKWICNFWKVRYNTKSWWCETRDC